MTTDKAIARHRLIDDLRRLHLQATKGIPGQGGEARRMLATLRHSLAEHRQIFAHEVVFRKHLPTEPAEQQAWLLIGGLFALHPRDWTGAKATNPSIGASLGLLDRRGIVTADRRLTQLLARDRNSLPYHLRQAIRLLSVHDIPVHYKTLLDDLTTLLDEHARGDRASAVRLRWAREYHLLISDSDTDEPAEDQK